MECLSRLRLCAGLSAVALLSACGGGGGGDPKSTLVLAGQVVLTQLAEAQNAHVTVTIGARSFETDTTSDGHYQVTVEGDPGADQLIAIRARGQAAGRTLVEMLSYIASLHDAQEDAGSDGRLTSGENVRANVTSVSTAEAALADERTTAKSQKAIASGAQLEQALRELDGTQVLDTAAAIKLIAEDPAFSLPPGQATTLTFARDAQDRQQFITQVQADPATAQEFAQAKSEIVADSRIVATIHGEELPNPMFIGLIPSDEFIAGNVNRFVGLTFDTATAGKYFNGSFNTPMTWSTSPTQLVVQLANPERSPAYFPRVDCNGDGQPDFPSTSDVTTGLTLTLLGGRAGSISFAGQTEHENCASHPTDPLPGGGVTIFSAGDLAPLSAAQFANRTIALPVRGASVAETFVNHEIFAFGASAGTTRSGKSFSWSVDDGTLVVAMADGRTLRYRVLNAFDEAASDFFVDITSPSGRFVDAGLAVYDDPLDQFVAAEVPARYFLGGLNNPRSSGFNLRLDPDGRGARDDSTGLGSRPAGQLRWTLEAGGDLVMRSYFNDAGPDCDPADPTCFTWDIRRVDLLNQIGERYYWFEKRWINDDGSQVDESTTTPAYIEVRSEDRVPLSGKAAYAQRSVDIPSTEPILCPRVGSNQSRGLK